MRPLGALQKEREKKKKSDEIPRCEALGTLYTLCQVSERDIVEPLNFLHDQLLLVDLDDERGIPFVSSEPELANRVL